MELSGIRFGKGSPISANPIEKIDTREKLAEIANVSHDTINKVEKIEEKAISEIKKLIRDNAISIKPQNSNIIKSKQ